MRPGRHEVTMVNRGIQHLEEHYGIDMNMTQVVTAAFLTDEVPMTLQHKTAQFLRPTYPRQREGLFYKVEGKFALLDYVKHWMKTRGIAKLAADQRLRAWTHRHPDIWFAETGIVNPLRDFDELWRELQIRAVKGSFPETFPVAEVRQIVLDYIL